MPRQVDVRTMRTQIALQARSTSTNALGEQVSTWSTAATVWAEATPVRARDQFVAGREQLPIDTVFRIRYRTGIGAETHRILWRSETYELHGDPIDVDGRRQTLELQAIKGVRDGLA